MIAELEGLKVNYVDHNPKGQRAIVLAHSLGTDLRMFDMVAMRMPQSLRVIAYDLRGHGQTEVTPGPYSMGTLVRDAEMLLDHLKVKGVVFVGVSIGGMIAQALAIKRLELVRGLVLANTATKIGTKAIWEERMATVAGHGLAGIVDQVMERWFSPSFIKSGDHLEWRERFLAMSVEGYLGCCSAISGTDLMTPTSGLRLPTLAIAGSEDRSTPPDLVREFTQLIPGSNFRLIKGAGHLPPIDEPAEFAGALLGYLSGIGHL
ncbi:MAG: 3-oxoadipate enol-lactonase [Deltaproteobacteria bacterium]